MRTSGTVSSALRAMCRMREASCVETLGESVKLTQVVPSSSSGRNSEPSRAATTVVRPKAATAMIITVRRRRSAQSRIGA